MGGGGGGEGRDFKIVVGLFNIGGQVFRNSYRKLA